MKAALPLAALLSVLAGCRSWTPEVSSTARLSGPTAPPDSAAPQPEATQKTSRQLVYFAGGFTKTGRFDWTNGMTLKDGIDLAGGFTNWATGRVQLFHRDGSQELYRLHPGTMLTNNPALQPGDVVISREHLPPLL